MEKLDSILVSVVIPAFRCAGTIAQVLDALLAQTIRPLRIIVVNDASPDGLADALIPYREKIEVVVNPRNLGLSKSYNVGLRLVDTEFAFTLHSDCILDPHYIENMLAILKGDKQVAAATGQYRFGNVADMPFADRLFLALNMLPREECCSEAGLQQISFIEGKADLFRLNCLREVGFFDERFALTAEDQDLSAKFRMRGWALAQDPSSHFMSAFGGTQDSVAKVIRKQRTYARGQALITLRYGRGVYASTTGNRNLRARHRLSQIGFTATGALLLAGVLLDVRFLWLWCVLVLLRFGIYTVICAWVGLSSIVVVALLGLWSDVWYTVGFVEGAARAMILKRT